MAATSLERAGQSINSARVNSQKEDQSGRGPARYCEAVWKDAVIDDTQRRYANYLSGSCGQNHRDEARLEATTWQNVLQRDLPEAYQGYLREYPEGPHRSEAGKRYCEAIWRKVDAGKTRGGYKEYSSGSCGDRHREDAIAALSRLEKLTWRDALSANTYAA